MLPVSLNNPPMQILAKTNDELGTKLIQTKIRLETQIQKLESQLKNELEKIQSLEILLRDQTERAENLDKELSSERKHAADLQKFMIEQEYTLKAQLENEQNLKNDLQKALNASQTRIEELNRQLEEQIKISLFQKQIEERNAKYREEMNQVMYKEPVRYSIITGAGITMACLGAAIGGPILAIGGCCAGLIGSINATQK